MSTSLPNDPIASALRSWLRTSTGLPDGKVIYAHQAGTQPGGAYIVIEPYADVEPVGMYDEQIQGNGDTATHIQRRVITCDVDFYGDASQATGFSNAKAAYDGLDLQSVRDALNQAGIALISRGKLENLSFVMETKFAQRFHFSPTFNVVTTSTEAVPAMAQASATGTLTLEGGTSVSTTISVTSP